MAKRLKLAEVIDLLGKAYGRPRTAEQPEAPLLDHVLVGVLTAWVDREKAVRSIRAIAEAFIDLNEARVSPLAELTQVLHPWLGSKSAEAANSVRTALQDVFDGTHGLDLEPLRGREPEDLKKFLRELPHTMGGPAGAIFQLALGSEQLALMPAEARVLERLHVLPRAQNAHRVRLALERQVKAPERLAFAWALGSHAGAVCRARLPGCETCLLLAHCPFGEAEVKKRVLDRKKEELRRANEEKRRIAAEARAARAAAKLAAIQAKKKAIADAKAARVAAAVRLAAERKAKVAAEKKAKAEAVRREKAAKAAKAKKSAKK